MSPKIGCERRHALEQRHREVRITLFEKLAVTTVAETLSLAEGAAHLIFHRPAKGRPCHAGRLVTVQDCGDVTIGGAQATRVERDDRRSQQQKVARCVPSELGMQHQAIQHLEHFSDGARLREAAEKKRRTYRPQ